MVPYRYEPKVQRRRRFHNSTNGLNVAGRSPGTGCMVVTRLGDMVASGG
jgi:hypothetical protein